MSIMSQKSMKLNYIYNVIYQVFTVIVPLITTPYISRVLSPVGIGQYSFSNSIITYFVSFSSLGFSTYGQREIAKYQGNKDEQSRIFFEVFICRLIPCSISLAVNLLLVFSGLYGDYTVLLLILSLNIVATALDVAFLFQGNEEFGRIVLRNIIIKTISVCAIFAFVRESGDVWKYTLINAIMLLVSNLSLWNFLKMYVKRVSISEIHPLHHLKGSIRLFIPTIATTIYVMLDKTLIGALITDTQTVVENGVTVIKKISDVENGYYEQSEKMVKLLMTVITCLGTVTLPRNSYELKAGHSETVKNNMYQSASVIWMLGIPMVFGLLATASNFVPWFYGEQYDKCIILIKMFSPLILIIGFSNLFSYQYLAPAGKEGKLVLASVSAAVTNIVLNIMLIPRYWSMGAVVASLCAEAVETFITAYSSKEFVSIKKIVLSSWKYLVGGCCMYLLLSVVGNELQSSIINTLILVVIGVVVYFVVLLLLKEQMLYSFIYNLKSRLQGR